MLNEQQTTEPSYYNKIKHIYFAIYTIIKLPGSHNNHDPNVIQSKGIIYK